LCPRTTSRQRHVFNRMDLVAFTGGGIPRVQHISARAPAVGNPPLPPFYRWRYRLIEDFVVFFIVPMICPVDRQGTTHVDLVWEAVAIGILIIWELCLTIHTDSLTAFLAITLPIRPGDAHAVRMIGHHDDQGIIAMRSGPFFGYADGFVHL